MSSKSNRGLGWSLFPPALNLPSPSPISSSKPPVAAVEDMNILGASDRRLSPILNSDEEIPDFGAEVRDIPFHRSPQANPKRASIEKRIDISRTTPQTHELSAIISSSGPAPLKVPSRSNRGRKERPSKIQTSDGEYERPRTASAVRRDYPERVASLGRTEYSERPGTSAGPAPAEKLEHPEFQVPRTHSPRPFSPEPHRPEFLDRPEYQDRDFRRGYKRTMPSSATATKSPSTIGSPRSLSRDGSDRSSFQTNATSLPALQQKGLDENDQLEPLNEDDLDPGSFDLVAPPEHGLKSYSLETRSEQLFSTEHLQMIFSDPSLLLMFTGFLSSFRSSSIPILIYYLDAIKAMKAISYSNAIADALEPLEGFDFTSTTAKKTNNEELEEKARQAFNVLVREELPAYITHTYIQTVSLSIQRRITGTLPPHLREASEGLAEVFCLTDPSRPDNPIVFSSEEFHRTTQYGMSYVIGRNCRFLQGPKTNPFSTRRLREKIDAGVEHCEVFLNYRRDGSPFMNLLMIAPLCDSRGTIRYFIGAQVDVSGLVKECSDLESLKRLVDKVEIESNPDAPCEEEKNPTPKDEFQELSEMLNLQELDTVRRWGGRMHKESQENNMDTNYNAGNWARPRLLISSGSPDGAVEKDFGEMNRGAGRLSGIYENYLLVRPYPSLRILFASPTLRVPGILQSPLMAKIGGSSRVRDELTQALANGRGVTAKVRWISKQDTEGRNRWIHCTPLQGNNGTIGVWMIVIVDDEASQPSGKRYRMPPPVDPKFGRSNTPARGNDSLRDFALGPSSRDRAGSLINDHRSERGGSERSGSPYTLRID